MDNILNLFKILSQGLSTTILIFILTLLFAIPLGIVVAIAQNSKNKILNAITKVVVIKEGKLLKKIPENSNIYMIKMLYYCLTV